MRDVPDDMSSGPEDEATQEPTVEEGEQEAPEPIAFVFLSYFLKENQQRNPRAITSLAFAVGVVIGLAFLALRH